jgi:hypothetical protein
VGILNRRIMKCADQPASRRRHDQARDGKPARLLAEQDPG